MKRLKIIKSLKMHRRAEGRLTEATRLRLTEDGRTALLAAPTCPGCPQCGLPVAEVTGFNSSFYECSEPDCYFEQAGQAVPRLEAAP